MTFFQKGKETVELFNDKHETYQPNTMHGLHLESDSNKPTIKRY